VTKTLGRRRTDFQAPDPLPDASDATVECAACHSIAVYMLGNDVVCGKCGALLTVEYTEVAPA
jgi:hypothetical protein